MTIDKQAAREDLLSEPGFMHLDNAGAALMPRSVLRAQVDHLQLEIPAGRENQVGTQPSVHEVRSQRTRTPPGRRAGR